MKKVPKLEGEEYDLFHEIVKNFYVDEVKNCTYLIDSYLLEKKLTVDEFRTIAAYIAIVVTRCLLLEYKRKKKKL